MEKFIEKYKKIVFRTIEKYKLVVDGDKLFIALSGGKDSGAAFYLTNEYIRENGTKCQVYPFHINFNLPVSQKVEEIVKKQCERTGVKLNVFNVSDYGIDMKKLAKLKRPICSSCGIIKRYLMNKIARENDATKIVTGHHAHDFMVFFIKNFLSQNFLWSSKFAPLLKTEGKSIAKARPLFFVSGEENKKFCKAIGFPYVEEDVCPHFYLKCSIDKKKEKWYEIIRFIEEKQPSFRIQMMNSIIKFSKLFPEKLKIGKKECKICGEPTNLEICAFCKLIDMQNKVS